MNPQMTIGQVAKTVGISTKTIRYYEEIQLLQPAKRMDNRYRAYNEKDIARLRFIKQARVLGLPLSGVKQLVNEGFDGTCEHLKTNIMAQLPHYIVSVKKRIAQLQALQQQLEDLQEGFKTLVLTHPEKYVKDNKRCEVLQHFEQTITKGGEEYGVQTRRCI